MSTMTKAQLATFALKHLGILAAGESASAADQADCEQVIDAVHAELSKEGLVPFSIEAIETWAQIPLRDYVAIEVGPAFGRMVMSPSQKASEKRKLRASLVLQTSGKRRLPVRSCSY